MFYWYFTGMGTVILFLSIIANIGFAQGWLRYERTNPNNKSKEPSRKVIYNWADHTGPNQREAN